MLRVKPGKILQERNVDKLKPPLTTQKGTPKRLGESAPHSGHVEECRPEAEQTVCEVTRVLAEDSENTEK